jgi:hypothetical protein
MKTQDYTLFSSPHFLHHLNRALARREGSAQLANYAEHKALLPFFEKPGDRLGTFVFTHDDPSAFSHYLIMRSGRYFAMQGFRSRVSMTINLISGTN